MKILFTGGGSGGHFYPIIAIAEAISEKAKEKKILPPKLYFMSPSKYNPRALFDNDIQFIRVPAGKIRRYFSLLNITDFFKTIYGAVSALLEIFRLYPDVVFGKGGYASFPALLAARILRIPVIIHESDSRPGMVNKWAGKFARKIALSYPEASKYFKNPNIAFTGLPIRREIIHPLSNGAREFLNLEESFPTILILGGSQGAQRINDVIIDALPELVKKYQVIHQTGRDNFQSVKQTADLILKDNPNSYRYHPFDYMNDLSLRMSAGAADIVVSRAGSAIFEIAAWGVPSIILPLSKDVSHDQVGNAFSYARAGGCAVIEDDNLASHILVAEIDNIVNNKSISDGMRSSAKEFSHADAAMKIADAILEIGLEHE
ncbi:MAG: UDP-N-acetylglucosamine--N-acetylmuramyl-(pentapeptide) pyrophosphoryl-undecaprenol N-acetylglucosamine transferase [bacterium]|nr:UDP-N-acetylglucosamine--N-acetylmuramyl-(pentapeptide) pyrophosphoryl-undecaprenol N-acetylglucosamine transferase [bacterium]